MSHLPAVTVAIQDYNRLCALLDKTNDDSDAVVNLSEELSRANLVDLASMPPGVVMMNSVVSFVNEITGHEHTLELVYPGQTGNSSGTVSILAPAGSALLGLVVGDSIEWPVKGQKNLRLRITNVAPLAQQRADAPL